MVIEKDQNSSRRPNNFNEISNNSIGSDFVLLKPSRKRFVRENSKPPDPIDFK